mgnify:FL=1
MKKLSNFLVEYELKSELPHVYLDMDGVLVDLMKGAFKVHGKEFRLINDDSVEAVVEDPRGILKV